MDAFSSALKKYDLQNSDFLSRGTLTTLQVNLGNLCNQSCVHCHIEASPEGKDIMSKEIIDQILAFLSRHPMQTLDITGGAPEMDPHFEYFVKKARGLVSELIIRSNLTILLEDDKKHLIDFYKEKKVHLVCSLPCYIEKNVDGQRGSNVFSRSVAALHQLNKIGFSEEEGLVLDLVYNPIGASLPPSQETLEADYKKVLKEEQDIHFNRLITITNVPIKRFKSYLESKGEYEKYCKLLQENFNPNVLQNIMCRTFISVGYDGKLYDCDFNQALELALKDSNGNYLTIDKLNPVEIEGREIIIGEHCLSCTAGCGSSCQGALASEEEETKESVKEYYGKTLKTSDDLRTSACCASESVPDSHKKILAMIEPEILMKFYGCGSPLPSALQGCTVLDLGCGTGRDVYLASYFVGEKGKVIGVDMTDEQIKIARKYEKSQAKRFGFSKSNVEFKQGYIENLKILGVVDNSVDVVISNCVINLSPKKKDVFSEIFRVLKPGGELFFSDVFADRRIPGHIKNDPVFYGECLGGAMYTEDFRRILRDVGFPDYRIVKSRELNLDNSDMRKVAGKIKFYSMTIRAFKIMSMEDICEDYGQVAVYKGGLEEAQNNFELDDHHDFEKGKPMLVCGNTASMLGETRFSKYFEVLGSRENHYGSFDACSDNAAGEGSPSGACC